MGVLHADEDDEEWKRVGGGSGIANSYVEAVR